VRPVKIVPASSRHGWVGQCDAIGAAAQFLFIVALQSKPC
jgi:hypothetical protein